MYKTIDLGEYIIEIDFNEKTNELDISVFDAVGEIIEYLNISNDVDDSEDTYSSDDNPIGGPINLN